MGDYQISKRKLVFNHPFHKVYIEKVKVKSGRVYDYVTYRGKDWVMVVPFVSDDKIVIVKQYRHGVKKMITGFSAGIIEKGESPTQAARRELAEELSMTAEKFEFIARIYPNPTRSKDICSIVFAYGARKIKTRRNVDELEGTVKPIIASIKDLIKDPSAIQHGGMLAGLQFVFSRYLKESHRRIARKVIKQ